ncbi:MAG: FAD-dependent oxidoreductase [Bacteroidetes bacterium]|nr:FAD-dependent oxidoreductase [Bacteroidota bacterium]MBU2586144.1 FAD-dependent oxidoreductase [Bacteroidota bacterium]
MNYDTIISGATLCGIVSSIHEVKKRRKVLLINSYGFPGGSITEALNIYQSLNDKTETVSRILKKIESDKFGILLRSSNVIFLNPESVKYIFQKEIEQAGIDVLFHVQPYEIEILNDGGYEITLIGREGKIKFTTEKIIDASDNFQISSLLGRKRKLLSARVNLLTNKLNQLHHSLKNYVDQSVQLEDGRYWLSFEVKSSDEIFLETAAHKKISELSELFLKSCGRIQILPAQTQMIYSIKREKSLDKNFYLINDLLTREFGPDEELLKVVELEKLITNEEYF